MRRIVILGTGTGVGKTYFTAALARALRAACPEAAVLALKPVETGCRAPSGDGVPAPGTDAAQLERASRGPLPRPHPLFAFRAGVSPHLAARQAANPIAIPAIVRWIINNTLRCTTLYASEPWVLVETAGGALSPLGPRTTNTDLAARLDPAVWILVAPDSLGVLHDLRATLLAMRQTARLPDHVVLTASRARDASTGTNGRELPRIGLARPACVLPRRRGAIRALAPLVRAVLERGPDARSTRRFHR